ncbi:MAG: energy-coupling factor ABC transporter ATP-binding protein [Roseburia sp.]|nr:energy-coupling factor ABC transporter ATP-binding protein [Anaeroplasma bactoclasticum]MCM1196567.1 energy-coupling factor ABC transporter ATP-binding protein [Roseburia sp.]
MKAIEFENLSFSYEENEKLILKNVDFSIQYGEVALLSGFSGEGKSTLLSIASGIIPNIIPGYIQGEVLIDEKSIKGQALSQICHKVGVVLQNADSQIIHEIVEDEIAFGCENFAIPKNKIEEQITRVCKLMKLTQKDKTRALSGGQKQRLITASTLATGQKILILDEPLANLDIEGAKELMTILRTLAKAGYAVLVVEHRLDMVMPFVDTVWDICAGVVKKIDNIKEYLLSQTIIIEDNLAKYEKKNLLFSINHISFSAQKKMILKDISFNIFEGERVLLLGENGCGKTTLLRLLARLYKPTSGKIEQYLDTKLGSKMRGKKWFKSVGVVYQNPNYQLFMPTVEKEILFNAVSKEYAEEILHLFGLDELKNKHPQSLSEGQKRRVSIAAVVAGNPKVLLLDEPTVGQDYKG